MEASNNASNDSEHSRSNRRRKTNDDDKENALKDRISNLPNPLRLHILSSLPTKCAARTSALSKKWQCLWTSIPILDFDDTRDICNYNASTKNLSRFVSFIHRTIILNQSPKFEKFRVCMYYKKAFASDIDVWLRFAARMNVEELDLDFSYKEAHSNKYYSSSTDEDDDDDGDDDKISGSYYLPMIMYSNNPSLLTLKLRGLEIDHGKLINWKLLKVLSLTKMSTDDDFMTEMLSGTPSLELLELLGCYNYSFLDIESENLKKLVIRQYDSPLEASPFEIKAPYLQSLDISGYLYEFSIINLSSLVDAKLNFQMPNGGLLDLNYDRNKYTEILVELLASLRHVKDLTLESSCLQVVSMLEEETLPCWISNWVYLRVGTSLDKREHPGIATLLARSPLLETLVINVASLSLDSVRLDMDFHRSYDLCEENYWSSQKSSFALALLHLKTVRIVDFIATKSEVEFLLFLLKNASKLEKMIIHARNTTSVGLKETLEVAQRILRFPRCSRDAVVLFS